MSRLRSELAALRTPPDGGAVVDRSDRGFVRVTGPDALTFLQALVSADLDGLDDGDSTESLLLHPQGKLDVAFRLVRVAADDLWLDTDPGLAPQLVASLERFKIRVDATIADRSASWGMLTVVGSDLAPGRDGPRVTVSSRAGVDVLGPSDELRPAQGSRPWSGATEVGKEAWEAFRIERGIPVQPVDIDDSTIPQEAELEVDAVSFTKGCFLGQELVCRIDTRGHVNRFLRRLVDIDGARAGVGSDIVADGKVVGAVTSVTPEPFAPIALGYVRREVEPGASVELRGPDGTARARVASLRPDA
jgi:hypothetical protein